MIDHSLRTFAVLTVIRSVSLVFLTTLFVHLLLFIPPAAPEELRLDDPAWLARASLVGIDRVRNTADATVIRTGESPSYQGFVTFPVEHPLDPQQRSLLEVTMKTDPRIHHFKVRWKAIGTGQPEGPSFLEQENRPEIYRDGAFHRYLIPFDTGPFWQGRLREISLGWSGAHGVIEIRKIAIRQGTSVDPVRAWWSEFWTPEVLNPAIVHAVGGPELLGQPFAFLLALVFVAFVPVIVLVLRRGAIFPHHAGSSFTWTSARTPAWSCAIFSGFLILWLLYDFRETSDHVQTLRTEFRYFLGDAPRPRHHFELDDFYDFIDAVQAVVPADSSIGFFSIRPLFVKARYFLFPRPVFDRESDPDYLVVFQDPHITYRGGQLKEKDIVVVDRITPFGRFGEDAFIYKRIRD